MCTPTAPAHDGSTEMQYLFLLVNFISDDKNNRFSVMHNFNSYINTEMLSLQSKTDTKEVTQSHIHKSDVLYSFRLHTDNSTYFRTRISSLHIWISGNLRDSHWFKFGFCIHSKRSKESLSTLDFTLPMYRYTYLHLCTATLFIYIWETISPTTKWY